MTDISDALEAHALERARMLAPAGALYVLGKPDGVIQEFLIEPRFLRSPYILESALKFELLPRIKDKPEAAAVAVPVDVRDDGFLMLIATCHREPYGIEAFDLFNGGTNEQVVAQDLVHSFVAATSDVADLIKGWPLSARDGTATAVATRSALSRIVSTDLLPDLHDDARLVEPIARRATGAEQAVLFAWMYARAFARRFRAEGGGEKLLDRLASETVFYRYGPRDGPGYVAAGLLAGADADDGPPVLGAFAFALVTLWKQSEPYLQYGGRPVLYRELSGAAFDLFEREVADDVLDRSDSTPDYSDLDDVFRLFTYVGECLSRQGIASSRGAPAFSSNHDETLPLIIRRAFNHPILAEAPLLDRQLPATAAKWFPLAAPLLREAMVKQLPQSSNEMHELVDEFAYDAFDRRRYTLDHVAIVDIDIFDFVRVILAPEQLDGPTRAEGLGVEFRASAHLRFALEHRTLGFLTGETVVRIAVREGREQIWLETMCPVLRARVERVNDLPEIESTDDRSEELLMTPLIVGLWRDLVVPDVVEQQYVRETVRKSKKADKGRRRERDVDIVSYLPRRLYVRRAEEQARRERGEGALRKAHWVGNYPKALAPGQHRSYEMDEYAREIRMPLQDWQTVVPMHIRGGTDEEKAALREQEPEVRHWRAWSAAEIFSGRIHRT